MDMDRFKFRVAIKQQDGTYKLYRVDQVNYYLHGPEVTYVVPVPEGSSDRYIKVPITGDSTILMQCTGYRDKNDKLIFESDIGRHNKYPASWLFRIAYCDNGSYQAIPIGSGVIASDYCELDADWRKNFERIGSIYEEVPHAES